MAKPAIDDSTYSVKYQKVEGIFTYIIKNIGAEVRGHGEKAPQ